VTETTSAGDVLQPFDLSGRVALITGAGSGIGRASAILLAGAGASVVCADLDAGAAEATARSITEGGATATARRVDVSSSADVDALVKGVADELGRLDVMGNIAGIMQEGLVTDTGDEDLERILGINLKGVFYGCRAAARVMVEQGSGSIVNMSSGAIDTPAPKLVGYAMAKAGVAQLTKTLAMEVAKSGVRVNAVAPGFVITGMTGRHFTNPDGTIDEERKAAVSDAFGRMAPLGRVGQPIDIAYAVLYLASDASSFMTGQILRPNGGVAMPW
jgi:3-oxoacyl-[acyl-carrier protein] reductase